MAHFGTFVTTIDPTLTTLAGLDRQRHIEPYLAAVAAARHPHTGAPLSASERRSRILTVGRMIDDINEWGWVEAPGRRLVFPRDVPRLPRPLPRYLPADADRRLTAALRESDNRLRADALLLARATGVRIGELIDLELDCVHEVPGAGAWLKVPLGKLDTERMVPLDPETLELIDRIVEHRSPGRPVPNTRTGRLADFLLTHQGRRVSKDVLRDELTSAAARAGLGQVTPHQLRHTFATALVNSGVSLQSLMATARACLGGDEPALRAAVRRHRPRRVRTSPHPGQSPARRDAATHPDPQAVPRRCSPADQGLAGSARLSRPASPVDTASAPPRRAPAPTPTSANTARASTPTPPPCRSWPRNAPTPPSWPPTPNTAAGPRKPPGTTR